MNRYADRFKESTYDNGAPCIIGLFDKELIENTCVEIFEGLLLRLINIGTAYQLHILQLFDVYEDVYLDAPQCENLLYELEFVQEVTSDSLLHQQIIKIKKLATECSRANGKLKLFIGGN